MPLQHAIDLLTDITTDKKLRFDLYSCETLNDLTQCMAQKGYKFTFDEFEDAVNVMHVKCQTEEQANEVMDKADWYRGLVYSMKV